MTDKQKAWKAFLDTARVHGFVFSDPLRNRIADVLEDMGRESLADVQWLEADISRAPSVFGANG